MAIKKTDEQNYIDIANAIRIVNGSEETYTPGEMAAAVTEIGGELLYNPIEIGTKIYELPTINFGIVALNETDDANLFNLVPSIFENKPDRITLRNIDEIDGLIDNPFHLTLFNGPTLEYTNFFTRGDLSQNELFVFVLVFSMPLPSALTITVHKYKFIQEIQLAQE